MYYKCIVMRDKIMFKTIPHRNSLVWSCKEINKHLTDYSEIFYDEHAVVMHNKS